MTLRRFRMLSQPIQPSIERVVRLPVVEEPVAHQRTAPIDVLYLPMTITKKVVEAGKLHTHNQCDDRNETETPQLGECPATSSFEPVSNGDCELPQCNHQEWHNRKQTASRFPRGRGHTQEGNVRPHIKWHDPVRLQELPY